MMVILAAIHHLHNKSFKLLLKRGLRLSNKYINILLGWLWSGKYKYEGKWPLKDFC